MVKNLPPNARDPRDLGSTPGSGISPEVGKDTLLQYSCLENSMDSVACGLVHGATKNRKWLSTHTHKASAIPILYQARGPPSPLPHHQPLLQRALRITHTCTHTPRNDSHMDASIAQKLVICSGYNSRTCNFKQLPSLLAPPRFQTIVSAYLWLCVLKAKGNCVQLQKFEFC